MWLGEDMLMMYSQSVYIVEKLLQTLGWVYKKPKQIQVLFCMLKLKVFDKIILLSRHAGSNQTGLKGFAPCLPSFDNQSLIQQGQELLPRSSWQTEAIYLTSGQNWGLNDH